MPLSRISTHAFVFIQTCQQTEFIPTRYTSLSLCFAHVRFLIHQWYSQEAIVCINLKPSLCRGFSFKDYYYSVTKALITGRTARPPSLAIDSPPDAVAHPRV